LRFCAAVARVTAVALGCRVLTAQQAALTLQDCIRLALAAPSPVSLARQDAEIARYGITAARSAFLPQVGVGNGFTYNSPLAGVSGNTGTFVALNGVREYQSAATTGIEIDTSGRLRADLARARADQQIAGANLVLTERDLKRSVAAAYYRLLLTRRLVAANRDLLGEAQSFAQRTEALFRSGEVARADAVKAQSQLAFLEQALQASELEARIANADLAAFWTRDVQDELSVEDKLTDPPRPDTQNQSADGFLRRPEFRLFDAERRGFEADFRRERAALLPQLTLNLQYGIDANRISWADRGQAAFFTFNVPVFDWFRARSLAQQFRLRATQVETRRAFSVRQFSRDYENALNRVRLIFEQIGMAERQVSTSAENLQLARIRYEGGEGPALDVVAAQTQLSQARTNYFNALAAYAMARTELEVASGR